ncbi:MAG: 2-C-methyl-D-erythritol 4-phosphate cytidylyltransferase [Candidatus Aenigmatarchaeota archaeon]
MRNVIIPAAGKSSRLGEEDKLLLEFDGKPAIIHTLEPFQKSKLIDNIILVTRESKLNILNELVDKHEMSKVSNIVLGGKTRQDSVYSGLKACPVDSEMVLVHDGGRPLVTQDIINNTIEAVEKHGAAVVGTPCKDTIKISENGFAIRTPNRDKLWNIQTPQGMKYDLALKAFKKAYEDNFQGTDDVSLVERLGKEVKIVSGSYENIKITTPDDIKFVREILENKK